MPKGIFVRKLKVNTCHPERKHHAKGLCRSCYEKTYQGEAKSKVSKKYWEDNKEELYRRKQNGRLLKLGWTQKSVEKAKLEQNNRCAICGRVFINSKAMHADHEHVVPPIPRGLLCSCCNHALGLFQDSPAILRMAADYVEKYQTQKRDSTWPTHSSILPH